MKQMGRIFLLCVGLWALPAVAQEDGLIREALDVVLDGGVYRPALSPVALANELQVWSEVTHEAGYETLSEELWQVVLLVLLNEDRSIRLKWYAQAYAERPTLPYLTNALAWAMVEQQGDAEGALQLLRGREERSIEEWDTLAWAQYKAGRKVDAMQTVLMTLRRAREDDVWEPILYDHAGDILYANGHIREAYRCWREGERAAIQAIRMGETSEVELFGHDCYTLKHARKKRAAAKKLHPDVFAAPAPEGEVLLGE